MDEIGFCSQHYQPISGFITAMVRLNIIDINEDKRVFEIAMERLTNIMTNSFDEWVWIIL
jgi:hypothetical protein